MSHLSHQEHQKKKKKRKTIFIYSWILLAVLLLKNVGIPKMPFKLESREAQPTYLPFTQLWLYSVRHLTIFLNSIAHIDGAV